MPSPIFLASKVHSDLHACPTMPIRVGQIALTARWGSILPSERLPKMPDEAARECGGASSQWSKHWTRGFPRKRQPTRSSPLHYSIQGTVQRTSWFCLRRWPILSISWSPSPSLHASLSSDPNHTPCRPQFLVKQWCSCLFPTDPRMRWLIFNYANLKQHGAHAIYTCLVFMYGLLFFPISCSLICSQSSKFSLFILYL